MIMEDISYPHTDWVDIMSKNDVKTAFLALIDGYFLE